MKRRSFLKGLIAVPLAIKAGAVLAEKPEPVGFHGIKFKGKKLYWDNPEDYATYQSRNEWWNTTSRDVKISREALSAEIRRLYDACSKG